MIGLIYMASDTISEKMHATVLHNILVLFRSAALLVHWRKSSPRGALDYKITRDSQTMIELLNG